MGTHATAAHLWRQRLRRQQLLAVLRDEGGGQVGSFGRHEGGVGGQAGQKGHIGGQAGHLEDGCHRAEAAGARVEDKGRAERGEQPMMS